MIIYYYYPVDLSIASGGKKCENFVNLLKLPGPASHIDRMQQIKIMTGSAAARVCRNSAEPAVKPELPEPVSQAYAAKSWIQ